MGSIGMWWNCLGLGGSRGGSRGVCVVAVVFGFGW